MKKETPEFVITLIIACILVWFFLDDALACACAPIEKSNAEFIKNNPPTRIVYPLPIGHPREENAIRYRKILRIGRIYQLFHVLAGHKISFDKLTHPIKYRVRGYDTIYELEPKDSAQVWQAPHSGYLEVRSTKNSNRVQITRLPFNVWTSLR